MIDVDQELRLAMESELADRLQIRHKVVATRIVEWLVNTAKKSAHTPDLLENEVEAIRKMAPQLKLHYVDSDVVVKATGQAEETLRHLRLGTLWYEPMLNLVPTVMLGLYGDE